MDLDYPAFRTDLLLTGAEANFIRENAYGDYDVTDRFYPCKLCLTYFYNDKSFKRHLSQSHSFCKLTLDYYYPTFVEPSQIVTNLSQINLNSSYPLCFAKNGDEFVWCCHLCGLYLNDPEIGHLFARIAAHILSKKLCYEKISKCYTLLTQCTSFSQMQVHFETLQWNCLQYQRIFHAISGEGETVERKCSFCSKTFILPKLLNNESAEILHILLEHDQIGSDDLLLRYLINSDAGEKFPFLDVLFGDTVEKKPKDRRFRCSKCSVIFKSYEELLLHGRFHLSLHKIDPSRYFFALPATTLNIILSNLIDGVSDNDKFPEYNYTIYVCTTCLQVMNPNGSNNFAHMVEHIKSCHFSEPSISIDQLPMALKETKFRIWIFPPTPCSTCGKHYTTAVSAKQCCIVGQPLSIFTKKRAAVEKKAAIEPKNKRKCDVTDFIFNTFSF
uniref:C2H2-type domain-containing protein n=1 Tax=Panagrolaimus superbus TaxID=310955 RepID=A0A914YLU3_9BILA